MKTNGISDWTSIVQRTVEILDFSVAQKVYHFSTKSASQVSSNLHERIKVKERI
jgi:hypothetical protein